jgi:hypothetical protein
VLCRSDISNTAFSDIDIYDIYIDVCGLNLQQRVARCVRNTHNHAHTYNHCSQLGKHGSKAHAALSRTLLNHIEKRNKRSVINPNPCIDTYLHDYMNLPAVQVMTAMIVSVSVC